MTVQNKIERARKAVAEISNYTQEQVDKLVYEGAKIIYKNAEPLARLAVDETGLGSYEDKICKNTDTPTAFWDYLKDKRSVGIINEDPSQGLIEAAPPPQLCETDKSAPALPLFPAFWDEFSVWLHQALPHGTAAKSLDSGHSAAPQT